jgi:hypothetical protein
MAKLVGVWMAKLVGGWMAKLVLIGRKMRGYNSRRKGVYVVKEKGG